MLSGEQRLTARQFQTVYQEGTAHAGRFVVLRGLQQDPGRSRWGFAVGKKLVRISPKRSRFRRRLRAVVKPMTIEHGHFVLTLRRPGLRATQSELREEIARLLVRWRTDQT